jgi:hypothetical protein
MITETGYRAYFWVSGFESADEVTSMLGVQPSASWRKGDQISASGGIRPDTAWTLEVDAGHGPALEERLERLLTGLEHLAGPISAVQRRFRTGINVAAYFDEPNPGFHLTAEVIARVGRLRLSLDFDLYCLTVAR